MPVINKLSAKFVEHIKSTGKAIRKSDGGGLYIYVKPNQTKFWEFRYTRPQDKAKACIGIGSALDVSLAEARIKAQEMRRLLIDGIDPQVHRESQKIKLMQEQLNTFRAVAEQWKSTKEGHLKPNTIYDNWRKLENYVLPTLGKMPVSEITAPLAISTLRPVDE